MRDGKLLRHATSRLRRRPQRLGIVALAIVALLILTWYTSFRQRPSQRPSTTPAPTVTQPTPTPTTQASSVKGPSEQQATTPCPSPSNAPTVNRQPCPGVSEACNGRGDCEPVRAVCDCHAGYTGLACEFDVHAALGKEGAAYFEKRQNEEREAIRKSSGGGESLPDSNKLLRPSEVSRLVKAVILPVHRSLSTSQLGTKWKLQVTQSIQLWYPALQVVEGKWGESGLDSARVEAEVAQHAASHLAEAWNDGLRAVLATTGSSPSTTIVPQWVLLLSPSVIQWHSQTNLELLFTMALTNSIEVIGFSTLYPAPPAAADQNHHAMAGEYVFHSDCWEMHRQRYVLQHRKPLFGYQRHIGKYAMMCDRTSSSVAVRLDTLERIRQLEGPQWLNTSMGPLATTDFYLKVQQLNARVASQAVEGSIVPPTKHKDFIKVATCVECLLEEQIENPLLPDAGLRSSKKAAAFEEWGSTGLVLPPPLRTRSRNQALFAERWNVEQVVGPHHLDLRLHKQFQTVALPLLEKPFNELVDEGRIACTKSGGIYGHSKRGLYSPLCHRYQRQRDFLYLAQLWCDSSKFNPSGKKRRYAVSLHHGNLFGALRMGTELLWETDGDFDLISFDDTHDEMMVRWSALQEYVTQHAGFEIRVTYPEKPWYASFLRDKTDFQLNVRGVKSSFTRGKPPQQHNVSVFYQGHRVFMNGFQNPWVGIRADPGHDYRRNYLAQQGWVLQFTGKSIHCSESDTDGVRHPGCLPLCNAPEYLRDFDRCSVEMSTATNDTLLDLSLWRDPILWV